MTSFISTDLIGRAAHALQSSREAAEARAVIVSAEAHAKGVGRAIGNGLHKVSKPKGQVDAGVQVAADAARSEATAAAALAKEAEEQYVRAVAIVSIIRTEQAGVLRLFDLSMIDSSLPEGRALASMLEEAGPEGPAATGGAGAISSGAGAAGPVSSVGDTVDPALIGQGDPWLPSYSFEKQWLAGEADPSFTGANQIGGAMTITASAQFDDLGGGAWQRIFDFGEGQYNGNIILGQHGGSQTDLVFQIMDGGAVYQVVAANALVEGERAVWTARVEADGTMAIFKNGDLLVSGAGFTPVAMDRSSGYVGHSNWSSDTPLIGSVYGIGIDDEALTDEMIKDLAQAGDPWQS